MTLPGTNPTALSPAASAQAIEFINSVMQLQTQVAMFDCDGTLWSGDAGEGFFDWELQQNLLAEEIVRWARARYAAYKAGEVTEEQMCGEMVTMHRGLSEAEVQRAADRYFQKYCVGDIFPEMQVLVQLLQGAGCDVWAVSSTNEWVIRAGVRHFGIPDEKILAAAVRIIDGKVTDRLVRVPSGAGKLKAIHEAIHRAPDAAFGNSIWDAAMLGSARKPFVINPTPQLQKIAKEQHWRVYFPDAVRPTGKDN
jgi:phosphoserine phosphatase